ncbi:amino acid permease-domain-containing protein [Podospora didyma]|uniref:Amino acid permease-domain-containing protein n=1 Tax=Podospora didyma TaxID=330526 RepID=A0AAE0U8M5_9PEZI|nr:amino acid permease-domain-containing protein [Podospora didyma]
MSFSPRELKLSSFISPLSSPGFFSGGSQHGLLTYTSPSIGAGIFNSPASVMQGAHSAGGALLLWFFGVFYGLAGAHLYIEYGLNVPCYIIEGIEQASRTPQLQFVYRWIYYKKDTVLLSGAAYLGEDPRNSYIRSIAIIAAALAYVIYAVSHCGGIWLNNILGPVKVKILLVIIATTLAIIGNGIYDKDGKLVQSVFMDNLNPNAAFPAPLDSNRNPITQESTVNGYAAALLSIIFAFSGFDQANYVLGEIKSPRKTRFPRATTFTMVLVSVLYIVVNICYMVVVSALLCAIISVIGNSFPLIGSWIPATADNSSGTSTSDFGSLTSAKYHEYHQQKTPGVSTTNRRPLVYVIRPEFEWAELATDADSIDDDGSVGPRRLRHGGKIWVHETVLFRWEGGENDMFGHMPGGPWRARGLSQYRSIKIKL